MTTVFVNGRFLTQSTDGEQVGWSDCMVIQGDRIAWIGSKDDVEVKEIQKHSPAVVDLDGRIVTPGFIDSHTHLLHFALSLEKVDLAGCKSLEQIRDAISKYAQANPDKKRILCRGWHQPSTGGKALASMIDDLDPRPIFIEALDLHSTWCSSSALALLPIEEMKQKCGEGHVACDKNGKPTGLLAESAQTGYVWPYLVNAGTNEERAKVLSRGFETLVAAGYTGAIDMAMDKAGWETLEYYKKANSKGLPIHVAAHWFVPYDVDEATMLGFVDEAIAMRKTYPAETSPDFCVVGIKLISDGVVDGCTAALSRPYPGQGEGDLTAPLWPSEAMHQVVHKAAAAGLQVAVHAIGDVAIHQAVEAIAASKTPLGRHRIEHLELATEEDARRLGELGITASVQPVHSDPEMVREYQHMIGPQLWKRAFAYKEFVDGHARVAIGTDAPTARHLPLPNLYNATTRRSATDPSMTERTQPRNALSLAQSIVALTGGAAYSRRAESWVGRLEKGLQADFVVLDTDWTPETLLESRVEQTWIKGQKVFDARSSAKL